MKLTFSKHDPALGLNAGFIALAVNLLVTVTAILMTTARPNEEMNSAVAAGSFS